MTTQARAPWLATPLIAVATFLGLFGLGVMIELGWWLRTVAFVLFLTATAVVITRLTSRSRALPTLMGAITAVLTMIPLFAVTEEGGRHVVPTPGALRDLGAVLRAGADYAATTFAPAQPDPAFTALVAVAVVALFLGAEHVAVSWRAAASAGLLLLIPWLPAVIFQHRVSVTALIAAIGLWLVVLAATRRPTGADQRPTVGGAATATAATLVGVLLVAPTALGGLGWGMIPRLDAPSLDAATRLNLALDLRTSLTANSTTPVLVYETTGARPDSFRLYSLTDFDGVQWSRESVEATSTPAGSGPLWMTSVDDWEDRERSRIEMQILDLRETNLPLPPTPRSIEAEGRWFYDAERDEVVGDGGTVEDMRYAIVTDTRFHQKEELQAAQAEIDAGAAPVDPRYLALSPAIDTTRVEDLAREVTTDASSRYDQALALQSFLRNTSEFTYDTSVDPTGGDSVSTFLDDREGYCVQFATTMVMMARTLDIPARMAVGFLPGSATDQGTYVVQGGDAHAWPELWFPGEGWVRFEPTPAIQSGVPPVYADPYAGGTSNWRDSVPGEIPEFEAGDPLVPDGTDPGEPTTPHGSQPGGDAGLPLWAWVAVALVVVLGVIAALWSWRRRGGLGVTRGRGPEAEWEALRRRLPEQLKWPATLTPHEAAERVAAQMRTLGPGLTGSAMEAMTRLSNAVADHRYAPQGSQTPVEQLREWADAVATEAETAVDAEHDGRAREGRASRARPLSSR